MLSAIKMANRGGSPADMLGRNRRKRSHFPPGFVVTTERCVDATLSAGTTVRTWPAGAFSRSEITRAPASLATHH